MINSTTSTIFNFNLLLQERRGTESIPSCQSIKQLHYGFRYHPDCCGHFPDTLEKTHLSINNFHIAILNLKIKNPNRIFIHLVLQTSLVSLQKIKLVYLSGSICRLVLEKPVPYQKGAGKKEGRGRRLITRD